VRKRPAFQMAVMGVIGIAIGIPLALIVPWFPSNASVQAGNVHTLYTVLLIVSVPIFVMVETVVLYSVWKFRMKPGEEEKDGPPIHGNTRLEVIWTAIPAVTLVALAAYAYSVLVANEATKPNTMTVNVTERQFAFEFSYPEAGGKTIVSPDLYLPDHRPVVFKLRSLDVIHSFFVPEFSQKLDAVPGITTTLRVTPTRIGTYPAECTELCGAGHSLMRAAVHVVTASKFQSWLSAQKPNAPPPIGAPTPNAAQPGVPGAGTASSSGSGSSGAGSSGSTTSAAAGKAVFVGSAGCGSCHTLAAAGTTGVQGPNLDTKLKADCAMPASKTARGASLQQCIKTAIVDPYKYLPSGYQAGVMPSNFGKSLTPSEVQALVNFLSTASK
jgi:cytochrome c oxidase subunit 2